MKTVIEAQHSKQAFLDVHQWQTPVLSFMPNKLTFSTRLSSQAAFWQTFPKGSCIVQVTGNHFSLFPSSG